MCIIFLYSGSNDENNDYSLILASNRDEFYDRPAQCMAPWEDCNIIAGRDLGANGGDSTWLAVSPETRKIGVLLNLHGQPKPNAKSRGRIAVDYVKSKTSTEDYINSIQSYCENTNEFVLVTIELGNTINKVQTYNNATNKLDFWTEEVLGFGNNLPDKPLKKVVAGKSQLRDICEQLNKISKKEELVDQLIAFLKSEDQHLPDHQLQSRRPEAYKHLSSIFVKIPERRYGTRTHTIVLVTKTGHVDIIEVSLQGLVNSEEQKWKRSEYQFDI